MHNIKQQMGFLDACHHHIFVIKILSHQRNLRLGYHILYIYMMVLVLHLFMAREMSLESTINLSSDCIHSIETT